MAISRTIMTKHFDHYQQQQICGVLSCATRSSSLLASCVRKIHIVSSLPDAAHWAVNWQTQEKSGQKACIIRHFSNCDNDVNQALNLTARIATVNWFDQEIASLVYRKNSLLFWQKSNLNFLLSWNTSHKRPVEWMPVAVARITRLIVRLLHLHTDETF